MKNSLLSFGLLSLCSVFMLFGCSSDDNTSAPTGNNQAGNNNAAPNNTNNAAPNNNSGTNNGSGAACTEDTDCGAGEACDTDQGICRLSCASEDDCSPTTRCQDGFCESRSVCAEDNPCAGDDETCNTCQGRCTRIESTSRICQSDSNCPIGEFCDPCRKVCRAQGEPCEPCEEDVACGEAGDLCLDLAQGERVCGASCADDASCPRGYRCQDLTSGQKQCVPASGNCLQPSECIEDTDCAPGMRCGPQLTCVAGCTEGTCPNGDVCNAGTCQPPCTEGSCPPGAECRESGLCQIPGGCLTSRDCPESGTYCDQDQQMCAPGCVLDDDCPGLQICRGNQCMRRPCDGNHLCAFGQICNKESGQCEQAEGRYCEECNAEAMGECGGEPNQCLRISDEDGNPVGDYCGVACDPEDLDACPVGYRCTELQDQNEQVIGNVCFRSCDRDPI